MQTKSIFSAVFFAITMTFFVMSCAQGDPQASIDKFEILNTNPATNSDGGIVNHLNNSLQSATYSIDCAFSGLNDSTIINTLLSKAKQSGIISRIAFDSDVRNSDVGALALEQSGLFSTAFDFETENKLLFGNKGDGKVFYTFCSVDEQKNLFVTAPISNDVLTRIPAFAFILNGDKYHVSRELHKEMNMLGQGLFGNSKSRLDFATKYAVLDQVVGLYWGPPERPMDVLAVELGDAEKSIDIYTTGFETTSTKADSSVPNVISKRLKRKIRISMVVSSPALFAPNSQVTTFISTAMDLKQYYNNRATPSLNFFIIDEGTRQERVAFFTGSIRSKANSSDDSALIILKGPIAVQKAKQVFLAIQSVSQSVDINPTEVTGPDQREIVINEIAWMGSMDDSGTTDTDDEFVELYNPSTTNTINITNWKLACTADGTNATSGGTFITMPTGAVIPPESFFVVAKKSDKAFQEANYYYKTGAMFTSTSTKCILTDGKSVGGPLTGTLAFTGTVVDTAGDGTNAFSTQTNMGSNADERRSMERIDATLAADNITNWKTNSYREEANPYVAPGFRTGTFASPGAANYPIGKAVYANRSVYFGIDNTHPNGKAIITVTDASANTNNTLAETLTVKVTSTSDPTGITLTLKETGPGTATFTSTENSQDLLFSTTTSSGNTIFVSSRDTIVIEYTSGGTTTSDFATWYDKNLVINEIGKDCNKKTSNDYIEIYNPNSTPVSLSDLKVLRDSGTSSTACTIGPKSWETTIPLSGSLAAEGYLLVAGSSYVPDAACPTPDIVSPAPLTVNESDCIALTIGTKGPSTATDENVLDFVGFGNASNPHEGSGVAANLGSTTKHECLLRKPNGVDTNDNLNDFVLAADSACNPRGFNFPFSVIAAASKKSDTLLIDFNEIPETVSAQTPANYDIPGLAVNNAVLSGKQVTLTTDVQTALQDYTLTVHNVTQDTVGTTLTVNQVTFKGYVDLVINEVGVSSVAVGSSGANDFVEIFNKTSVAVDLGALGYTIQRDSSCNLSNGVTGKHALTGTIPANGYYVIANNGNTLDNVNQADLENIADSYCVILTTNDTDVTSASNTNVVDWVTIGAGNDNENGVTAPSTTANGAISRMPNGTDTDNNSVDFKVRSATPGAPNDIPTYTSTPTNNAVGVLPSQDIVLIFGETMDTGVGTINLNGTSSGAQNSLTCAWSQTTVLTDTCTVTHSGFTNDGETVTVTLDAFKSAVYGISPAVLIFSFTTTNAALTPTVTNVVVASTNPNNGTTPFNTGETTLTITGTNFTGTTGVSLDDLNGADAAVNTPLTSVTVDSNTQITATVPAGVRTNSTTGWNVIVTTGNGSNATSDVTFVPKAGLLISEVVQNGSNGASSEFIEIYNPTGLEVDIGASGINLRLHLRSSAGANTKKTLTTVAVGCATNDTTIPSHGFYLIASTGASTETWYSLANMTYSAGITLNGGAYVSLSNTTDLLVIDKVGWGTVPAGSYEGTAVSSLGSSESIERKPAGGGGHATDTDDNSQDFNSANATMTPQNCLSSTQP